MNAFVINSISDLSVENEPLELWEVPLPEPGAHQIRIKVSCCAICHTELDEIEGRTPPSSFPRIPGHQVVGVVDKLGEASARFSLGDRVGVAWIFQACGSCEFCIKGKENLCRQFMGTGRDANGGYAEFMTIDENFAFYLPVNMNDVQCSPMLCAGAIGYRSLKLTNLKDEQRLGLTGFGASGHLVLKMAKGLFPKSEIVVFARSKEEQDLARSLGASWAGNFTEYSSGLVDAIIDTTPAWLPPINSLRVLKPGGRLVINAIRKESGDQRSLMDLSYHDHLWMEKEIKSVANITRKDVETFLKIASYLEINPEVELYDFKDANRALVDLKKKSVRGAKVLIIDKHQALH